MPTLPTAADILGKVSPTSQAPVKIQAGAFPDYSGAYEIGSKLADIGFALKDQDDTTEAQDLSNKLNAARRELYDGISKEQPGFGSLKGRHARDDRKRVEEEFERRRKELFGSASNDAVRRKVTPVFAKQSETFLGRIAGHVRTQNDVYTKEVNKATTVELRQIAIENGGDARSIQDVYHHAYGVIWRESGSTDAARSAAETARSNAHLGVVNDLMPNDPVAAREYFEANKSHIDRPEWKDLIPAIKDNEQNVVALADRLKLEDDHDLTTADGKRNAHAYLDKKYANRPDQLAKSKDALDATITRVEKLKTEAREEIIVNVRKKILENPGAALNANELNAVRETKGEAAWIRKVRKIGGRPVVSDDVSNTNLAEFQDEYELWVKNPDETPSASAFKVAWDTKLNPTHYDEARKKVDALRAHHRGEQVDAGETTVMTNGQRIKNALIQVGMHDILEKSSQRSDESKIAQAQFTTEIGKLLRAEAKKLKRELYPDEAENIIDRAAANLVWVNSVLGSGDPRYPVISLTKEIIDGDDIYVPLEKLSTGRITTLRNTLRQTGIYASDSNVEELAGASRRSPFHVYQWLRENAPSSPQPPTSPTINTQPLPNTQGN